MKINTLDDFIKIIPKELETIIERARFLYLELGKRSFYDTEYKYFMFGEEEEYTCYSNKSYSNPNIIICTTLAKQYTELLIKAGIDAEIAYENGHYLVKFYDENGDYHFADITNDLKNIQFGCRTRYFGAQTINEEKLRNIDLKLGYITEKISYTEDYWYLVKEAIGNVELSERKKLEIVLNNLQKYGDVTKPGDTEIFSIYQKFVRYCLPDSSGVTFYSTKPSKDSKEKCYIEIYDGKEKIQYVLDSKTRLFQRELKQNKDTPNLFGNER